MMKLYFSAGACSRASHIALEEAGAQFEPIRVNMKENQQRSPEYLALNPKGRVPTLVTDKGILTETPAILAWIGQTFPGARLAPADPFEFAKLQAFNSYLCSTVHPAHAHRPRAARWTDDPAAQEALRRYVPTTMTACFELIENEMFAGPWVMGETYTVADPYLFTISQWLESDSVDPARFPKVHDHRNRMEKRAAVRKVLEREEG